MSTSPVISLSDIYFYLSGGSKNTNPLLSLGGVISSVPCTNALFNSLTETQIQSGYTDYRCIYAVNTSLTNTLYDIIVYNSAIVANGCTENLGFVFQNDVQQIIISNGISVSSGSFILEYNNINFTIPWANTLNQWASNFQNSINAIKYLKDVTVNATNNSGNIVFQVNFVGDASNRYHPILNVISSSLSPAVNISISKLFNGSPINYLQSPINVSTTTLNLVNFLTISPIYINADLRAGDFLPIWIKRICLAGQNYLNSDGFTLNVSGKSYN